MLPLALWQARMDRALTSGLIKTKIVRKGYRFVVAVWGMETKEKRSGGDQALGDSGTLPRQEGGALFCPQVSWH
jgi:hypothetical protein